MPFVVVAEPGVDVDASDCGGHAFLLQDLHYLLNLFCCEFVKLTVVKGDVGFAAW